MNKDQYVGVSTALFGLLVVFVLVPLGVDLDEVDADTHALVRPDFWPNVVGYLMVLVGVLFTFVSRAKPGSAETQPMLEVEADESAGQKREIDPRRILWAIGVLALFGFTNDFTGLFLPSVVMFIVCAIAYGGGRVAYIAIGAIFVPVLLQQFFERVANIPIPMGILEGLLV